MTDKKTQNKDQEEKSVAEQVAEEKATGPAVGDVVRDDRYGDGYVLVVGEDEESVSVVSLGQARQVGRHALED